VLEAGTAPAASNAAQVMTAGHVTSVVAHAVPVGIYYVRVRAVGAKGSSALSTEISVVVGHAAECSGAPQPASALAAAVTGRNVQVNWAAAGTGCAASQFVLLAGSAPGLRDLAQATVNGHSLAATAPPGTYFVRVIAINMFGASAPSQEIVVTIRP
jgi:hypothetical protein